MTFSTGMFPNAMFSNGMMPGGFLGIFAGLAAVFFSFEILIYFLVATAFFFMFRKAHVPLPWLAYIPIAQLYPFFLTIEVSQANFLWLLAPFFGILLVFSLHGAGVFLFALLMIAYIVFAIRWLIRLLRAFSINPLWLLGLIGLIIPGLSYLVSIGLIVLYCIMGFNPNIHYRPPFSRRDAFDDDNFKF